MDKYNWTSDKPTEPGYYWGRVKYTTCGNLELRSSPAEPVLVSFKKCECGKSETIKTRPHSYESKFNFYPFLVKRIEWSGPLEPPIEGHHE
jgi:hypothetical protein